jgi:hypothetical protein
LLNKDKCGDICLGSDEANIVKNINVIKVVRTSRLVSFHDNNPHMFLLASIDITTEEQACRTHIIMRMIGLLVIIVMRIHLKSRLGLRGVLLEK